MLGGRLQWADLGPLRRVGSSPATQGDGRPVTDVQKRREPYHGLLCVANDVEAFVARGRHEMSGNLVKLGIRGRKRMRARGIASS